MGSKITAAASSPFYAFQIACGKVQESQLTGLGETSALSELTQATSTLLSSAEKSADIFSFVQTMYDKLPADRRKNALLAVIQGTNPSDAQMNWLQGKSAEALLKNISTIFTIKASGEPPTPTGLSHRAAPLGMGTSGLEDRFGTMQRVRAGMHNTAAVAMGDLFRREITYKMSEQASKAVIANIVKFEAVISAINNKLSEPLTYLELTSLLNKARATMEAAERVVHELAEFDDVAGLTKKITTVKESLKECFDKLNNSLNTLISSDQCVIAIEGLSATGTEEEQAAFEKNIERYQEAAGRAIALVHVDEFIASANQALDSFSTDSKTALETATDANTCLALSTKASENIALSLNTFNEARAAIPKFENPLLAKLRNAQAKLNKQVDQKITGNETLQKVLSALPEQAQAVIAAAETTFTAQSSATRRVVESTPESNQTLTDVQKAFAAHVVRATGDDSILDASVRKNISTMAPGAIRLLATIETNSMIDSDLFALFTLTCTYVRIYRNIIESYDRVGQTAAELQSYNSKVKESGVHDLAAFFNAQFGNRFSESYETIQGLFIENKESLDDLLKELSSLKTMREDLARKMQSQ